MRTHRRKVRGFSLIEVVIAVGIFAAAVAVMLGLLPSLTRQAVSSADIMAALRLPDAVRLELQRVATLGGFDTLAGQTKPMATPLPATLNLVGSRDAMRAHTASYQPPPAADRMAQGEQYFLVEVWSFNQAPLSFDPGGTVLALHVRVSWPYFIPGSPSATPLADREQVTYNLSLNR
jgi:prepilin-type N-terminal cleavage/methylation domain-containing protein